MGNGELLRPEDRAEFESVLDEALRVVLAVPRRRRPTAAALRVRAYAARNEIAACADAQYRRYVDVRTAAGRGPEPRGRPRALREVPVAVAGAVVAGVVDGAARGVHWSTWVGVLSAGVAVGAVSLPRFVRERRAASDTAEPAAEYAESVAAARRAWLDELMRSGVLPYLENVLDEPARPERDVPHSAPPRSRPPRPASASPPSSGSPSADSLGGLPTASTPYPGQDEASFSAQYRTSVRSIRSRPRPFPSPAPSDEPHRLTVELAEQASPGRDVPLHVRIVRDLAAPGVTLRAFAVPPDGARLLITVHAPALLALGDLQQELLVTPGRDSDVLRFGLRTTRTGLHTVTVRAFHGGTFLGELRTQISVEDDTPTRDGPTREVRLPTVAFDPGEVTLQVLRGADGSYSFQLLSERCYAPESFRLLAGDPRGPTERIYEELRRMAAAAGKAGPGDGDAARRRLRNLGVQLWSAAVPDAVRRQFWAEAGRISSFTVLGEHDLVPWELLYPLDGASEGDGFLAEWLPVVRRVFGQERIRELDLPRATYVVPPGSPVDAAREVEKVRRTLGRGVADGGVLAEQSAVTGLIDQGLAGLLHFACHNSFTDAGSSVKMSDGAFDPIDLAYATQSGALRRTRPLVFFNACRSAGGIDWFSSSLGWAPQFLRAGAGAFIGSLWPVRSDSALAFADIFYFGLVSQRLTLGQASIQARRSVRDRTGGDPTWLAYAVYGSPAARVNPRT
ncbi:CHAT domain-containing protein [Streptomyces luteireticuli]|uniref:CHAT domain-containing protein n=1 Tax=Streptomyces luteireticuli TaxID=173858 RepID=UPI00355786FB